MAAQPVAQSTVPLSSPTPTLKSCTVEDEFVTCLSWAGPGHRLGMVVGRSGLFGFHENPPVVNTIIFPQVKNYIHVYIYIEICTHTLCLFID